MKAAWIAAVVALLGGGAWLLFADDAPSRDKAKGDRARAATASQQADDGRPLFEDDDDAAPAGGSGIDARVAKLEREVASLRQQVGMLKGVSGAFARGGDGDAYDDAPSGNPEFDDAVRAVLADERTREREEDDERRRERWETRSQERLDELVSEFGVSPAQRESLSALWSTEREKATALITAARSGEQDFEDVREQMETMRKETDAEAAKLLSSDQYAAYEELRPRGPGGRGGRGGRGGGGGRRGGGGD